MNPDEVLAPLQRQGRELECGDPALRPAFQGADLGGGQPQAHPGEVRRGLRLGEAQVGGTYLGQLASGSQPREGQRRVGPRGDDQAELGRQVVDQERHGLVDLGRVDDVVVVEHEHDVLVGAGEVVDDAGQHGGDGRTAGRLQECLRGRAQPGRRRAERGEHVGPVGRGVAVTGVQGQPGHGRPVRPVRVTEQQLGEQRGLPEACRSGHEQHRWSSAPTARQGVVGRRAAASPGAGRAWSAAVARWSPGGLLTPRAGADVHPLPRPTEDAQHLGRALARRPEPVG